MSFHPSPPLVANILQTNLKWTIIVTHLAFFAYSDGWNTRIDTLLVTSLHKQGKLRAKIVSDCFGSGSWLLRSLVSTSPWAAFHLTFLALVCWNVHILRRIPSLWSHIEWYSSLGGKWWIIAMILHLTSLWVRLRVRDCLSGWLPSRGCLRTERRSDVPLRSGVTCP